MSDIRTCPISRRSLIRGAGLTLAGFGVSSLLPPVFIRNAIAAATGDPRFMFIFLRGGNDGLNTVIPHGDADYNSTTRPTLYIPPGEAIDLGNGFASLHPALEDLMDAYNAGDLAVLHRIGYANSSHSHIEGQRIWENGDPQQAGMFEGWLYRMIKECALDQGVNQPVLSVQLVPPLLLRGDVNCIKFANPDTFNYHHGDPKLSNWDPKDPVTGWSLFPVNTTTNPDDVAGPNGKKFATASYSFFQSLKVATLALLESGSVNNNGTRIAGVELNGFDTHGSQGNLCGAQPTLLNWLGYGLKSVRVALSGRANDPRNYPAIWSKTVVGTMSEFGRTSKENGSFGTDHSNASCMFVQGGPVNGGLYNLDKSSWPAGSMFDVVGRHLSPATDYRSVYWEIMRNHMGADPMLMDSIFPNYTSLGLASQEPGLV